MAKGRQVSDENLGISEISGLEVEGTKMTSTLPEGVIGNDRPITRVEEKWHSQELDVDVQVTICPFHPRPNCRSRTQIATSYWRLAVIAAHLEELCSALTLSWARQKE